MARMKVKVPVKRKAFAVEIELVFIIVTPYNLLNVWYIIARKKFI